MQVTENSSEGLKRGLTIVVPAAEIETQLQDRLKEVAKTANLPGFRKGKVPVSLIKARYGDSVRGEVLEKVVDESSRKAFEEKDLKPATQPQIDVKSFEAGKDLEYTLDVEVLPEITPMDFSTMDVEMISVAISDEELDEAMTGLAERAKTSEPIEDERACENGDIVVIDFKGEVDGKTMDSLNADDFNLELGSGMFIPGFEDQVVGLKADESKTVDVTFPENYGGEELAGKPAKFDVKVKEIRKAVLPEIDDAFAEKMGQSSLEELKTAMKTEMEGQYAETARSVMKRRILDELDEKHDFELPETMQQQEFDAIWQQIEADKEAGRLDETDAAKDEDTLKADYKKIADRRVKLGLLLSDVGNRNEIEITEADMTSAVIKEARKYPGQEQQVVEYFQKDRNAQLSLRAPILEDKVIDYIVALAKTSKKDVSIKELNEVVEQMEKEDA